MTDVVAALIWNGDRFLACQRPSYKARGLLWEFVGGKVEPGETKQEALIRECMEELAVIVKPDSVFMELVHEYPDLTVRLTLFNAVIEHGIPQKLEHNDIRWITTAEIDEYDFCPADVEILAKLKRIQNGIQANLLSLADEGYRDFQCSLMPTVDPERVLGVRMPALRKYAKHISKEGISSQLMEILPHRFYEEDNLHGVLISEIRDYNSCVQELDRFLPYVDNWSTCDMITPKAFKSCPDGLPDQVKRWLCSGHVYTVRFAIGILMRFYLDQSFDPAYLELVAGVKREEYYINMMIAWYFATALAKKPEYTLYYFENKVLDKWTHNKAIQKAVESYRISDEMKAYLKTLKR